MKSFQQEKLFRLKLEIKSSSKRKSFYFPSLRCHSKWRPWEMRVLWMWSMRLMREAIWPRIHRWLTLECLRARHRWTLRLARPAPSPAAICWLWSASPTRRTIRTSSFKSFWKVSRCSLKKFFPESVQVLTCLQVTSEAHFARGAHQIHTLWTELEVFSLRTFAPLGFFSPQKLHGLSH